METHNVTVNIPALEKTIRDYLATLVYEDEIPVNVDMAITLLSEAAEQNVNGHPLNGKTEKENADEPAS